MINKKQEAFFKALKQIKDFNIEAFSSYLHPKSKCESTLLKNEYKKLQGKLTTDEDVEVFKKVQNELIENALYDIMVLIDGYGRIDFEVHIIDKESKESLKKDIQLHDEFANFLRDAKTAK